MATLQTVWTKIRPNKTSSLIWIQLFDTDGIRERFFEKLTLKKKSTDDKKACKELNNFLKTNWLKVSIFHLHIKPSLMRLVYADAMMAKHMCNVPVKAPS